MIKPNERLDDLGINNLSIIQNPEFFCFGIDAVLLSDYAKGHKNERILDLCSGNGILPILLSAKTKASEIIGLEIQKSLWEMSLRSIKYNNLSDKVKMILGDVRDSTSLFDRNSFNVITVNPPYMKACGGKKNDTEEVRIARHEELCTFEDIIKSADYLLKQKGRIYIVHRPLRLAEIMATMVRYGIEPKGMRLVYPFIDKEPNLVLIEGIKGAAPELRVAPPLVVYDSPGKYTKEVLKIYGYDT